MLRIKYPNCGECASLHWEGAKGCVGAEKVEKQEMLMAVVGGDSDVVVHIGKITIV